MRSQRYQFVEESSIAENGKTSCRRILPAKFYGRLFVALVAVTLTAIAVWQHFKLLEQYSELSARLNKIANQVEEHSQRLTTVELHGNDSIQNLNVDKISNTELAPAQEKQHGTGSTWSPEETEIPVTMVTNCAESAEVMVSPGYDSSLLALEKKLNQLERTVTSIAKVATVASDEYESAQVALPKILIRVNASQTLMCESYGKALSSCFWGYTKKGQRELIIIDQTVLDNGGATPVDGISYVGAGLEAGICGLKVESVTEDDAGTWSCMLISQNGKILTGEVELVGTAGAAASRSFHAPVLESNILIQVNISQTLSCDSNGQPLSACFWTRNVNGQRKEIIIDQEIVDNNGTTSTDGITYFGDGLAAGNCGLKVKGITEDDVGAWSCTLLTKNGMIWNRTVNLMNVTGILANQPKSPAAVSYPIIYAKGNESQTVSCESHGQPLSACVWEVIAYGTPEILVFYEGDTPNSSVTSVDGIVYTGDGLHAGECGIEIESVFDEDVGPWYCTLVMNNGTIFTGVVAVKMEVAEPSVYFLTSANSIKAISLGNLQVQTIAQRSGKGLSLFGIAYDSMRHKLYWSSWSQIYRAYRDGSEIEMVFDASRYGTIHGMDFEWITGNIYMASERGYVLACDAKLTHGSSLRCFEVIQRLSSLYGITIDPIEGTLYLSRRAPGSIMSAVTDGTNITTLVSGLRSPYGISMDFPARKIYWTDEGTRRIQSCDKHGRDIRTIVQLQTNLRSWGVALYNDTIYWGNYATRTLQSSDKDGRDIRNLYKGDYIGMMTIVPPSGLPTNRTNNCKGQRCSGICVLTSSSFRCLN